MRLLGLSESIKIGLLSLKKRGLSPISSISYSPVSGVGVYMFHRILRQLEAAGFNRRMRKTARPVVWEG
jgi:hypothetical protein